MGEEDRDHGDRAEVVDDGQGEQEGPQRGGQLGAHEPQDRQGEGDVGGHRDGPALRPTVGQCEVDAGVDQGGDDHAAQGRDDRDQGLGRLAQGADGQLPLELEAGHEEEDRQQPVGGPVLQVERPQRQVQHRLRS